MRFALGALLGAAVGVIAMARNSPSGHRPPRDHVDNPGEPECGGGPAAGQQPSGAALHAADRNAVTQDRYHQREERHYWRRSLRASWAAAGAAIAAALFAAGAFHAAQRQADIAHATLVASARPWLSLDASVAGPVRLDGDKAEIPVTWAVQNRGHSPAQAVAVLSNISIIGDGQGRVPDCREFRDTVEDGPGGGPILFPEERSGARRTYTVSIPLDAAGGQAGAPDGVFFGLHACVGYYFGGSPARHTTPVAYLVGVQVEGMPDGIAGFKPGTGSVPAEQVRIGRTNAWAGPAD